MKILSIDDSAIVRKIIKVAIEVLEYEFEEADGGSQAMALLSDIYNDVDLILLDWNMPEMNGYEVLKKLKSDKRFKTIPVMMVTTDSDNKSIVAAIKAGAINYLTKPFTVEELIKKIMECVGE